MRIILFKLSAGSACACAVKGIPRPRKETAENLINTNYLIEVLKTRSSGNGWWLNVVNVHCVSILSSRLKFSGFLFLANENPSLSTEPLILMESTMPLTLENILEYEEAVSGDCIVGVPEVSPRQGCSWGWGGSDQLAFPLNFASVCFNKSVRDFR